MARISSIPCGFLGSLGTEKCFSPLHKNALPWFTAGHAHNKFVVVMIAPNTVDTIAHQVNRPFGMCIEYKWTTSNIKRLHGNPENEGSRLGGQQAIKCL